MGVSIDLTETSTGKRLSRLPCGKALPYRNCFLKVLRLRLIRGIASKVKESNGKAKPYRTEDGKAGDLDRYHFQLNLKA